MEAKLPQHINSIIQEAFSEFEKGNTDKLLSLDLTALSIRVKGKNWSGVVDRPMAKFILDLDKKIESELKACGIDFPAPKHGYVSFKISEGSLLAEVELAKELIANLKDMPPEVIVVLILALLVAYGIHKAPDIIRAKNEEKLKKAEAQKETDLIEKLTQFAAVVGKLGRSEQQLQAPLRSLIDKMDENDTIHIPSMESPVKKEIAKDTLAKRSRSTLTTEYIDQRYIVDGIVTKNPSKWTATLRYGSSYSFPAILKIAKDESDKLLADLKAALEQETEIAIDMQVTAQVSSSGIYKAEIIGLGVPRANNKGLARVLQEYNLIPS